METVGHMLAVGLVASIVDQLVILVVTLVVTVAMGEDLKEVEEAFTAIA